MSAQDSNFKNFTLATDEIMNYIISDWLVIN